ncbi:MAG: glycerol kinase, partial [Actinomycetota bacterium]|nr:glycerol kinase [Actinomycetota bacterium]
MGALDQGTTSSRFMVFDREGRVVAAEQRPHEQIFPSPGWVEHDPIEIWRRCREVIAGALEKAGLRPSDLAALGVANQRETIVVWDRDTGAPLCNAIVWQDTRTRAICEDLIAGDEAGIDRFRALTGLPVATYFSGPKLQWVLDELDLRMHAARGEVLFGTMDTWLIWNLTGGPDGGVHVTDVTNASRTLLMDLTSLQWDAEMLGRFSIPRGMLPEIRSSSEVYGTATGVLPGVPVAGALGDQQAALFGQCCFDEGDAKNTYGTGCFLLVNTGGRRVASSSGLITTAGYRIGDAPAVYCLEGSVAMAGAVVQWLRDNLGIIASSAEVEALAASVPDNGGAYLVPAFSGLFAPYWRSDARGVIAGLTRSVNKGHLARAALEATAFQTVDAVRAQE